MAKRIYRRQRYRFTFYIVVSGWLFLGSSCVSMSKYKKVESDLTASETQRNEMSAKSSILEIDTTEYGIKVRMLQNDIGYLQNIGKSEKDKSSNESDKQKQLLNDTHTELEITKQKLREAKAKLSRTNMITDSLETLLKDSLQNLITNKKIRVEKDQNSTRIDLHENAWDKKKAAAFAPEAVIVFDRVIALIKADSSLIIEIERTGHRPEKTGKPSDQRNDNAQIGKPNLIWDYFIEKGGINANRVKIVNIFTKMIAAEEGYVIVVKRNAPN